MPWLTQPGWISCLCRTFQSYLFFFFGQVDQLQNELEREKKRSRDERQNSEQRIKELQTQVEKLKLGRILTQQAVDEEKCLGSEVPSREEAQKRKCTDGNVGSVKKVRFAVEDDSHVQELDAAPPSEHLFRLDPSEVVVECPTITENIPQENNCWLWNISNC